MPRARFNTNIASLGLILFIVFALGGTALFFGVYTFLDQKAQDRAIVQNKQTVVDTGIGLVGGPSVNGQTVTFDLEDTAVVPGNYSLHGVTVDGQGRLTAILPIDIFTGVGLIGGPLSEGGTIDLENTTVTPGLYEYATVEVDAQGRLTMAMSNSPVVQVNAGTGLIGGPIVSNGTLALSNTTVTPGTYGSQELRITVDQQGRLTNVSSSEPNLIVVRLVNETNSTNMIVPFDQILLLKGSAFSWNATTLEICGFEESGIYETTVRLTAQVEELYRIGNYTFLSSSGFSSVLTDLSGCFAIEQLSGGNMVYNLGQTWLVRQLN